MNPQTINHIYGYIRVSVAKYKSESAEDRKREEENRISIIEQETKIKEYAQKMGKEVKQFFTDYGKDIALSLCKPYWDSKVPQSCSASRQHQS